MKKGWKGEKQRHSLAKKGIKTNDIIQENNFKYALKESALNHLILKTIYNLGNPPRHKETIIQILNGTLRKNIESKNMKGIDDVYFIGRLETYAVAINIPKKEIESNFDWLVEQGYITSTETPNWKGWHGFKLTPKGIRVVDDPSMSYSDMINQLKGYEV